MRDDQALTDQSRVGTSSNNSSATKFVTESWKANEVRLEAVAPATPQSLTGERKSSVTVGDLKLLSRICLQQRMRPHLQSRLQQPLWFQLNQLQKIRE